MDAVSGGYEAGLTYEVPGEEVPEVESDRPADALYRKGKGKGKGKNPGKGKGKGFSPGGGGKGYGAGGAAKGSPGDGGKGEKTKLHCSWCHVQGHLMRDCRKRAAGEPRKPHICLYGGYVGEGLDRRRCRRFCDKLEL